MVKKAIVLAAGVGTRLKPITDAIPKEMIRVGKKPAIEHVLEVLKAGGIEDVLIIVGWKKHALVDYLGSGKRLGLKIYFRMQEEPKGTAHAVSLGDDFIGDEDFVVMYGDNYITPYDTMEHIVDFHKKKGSRATLVLNPVEDPRRFGVVKMDKDNQIHCMIEKPTWEEAEPYRVNDHWLNIAGLMVLNSDIFRYIRRTEPGKKGEIWLTDSIELMRQDKNAIYGYIFTGKRFDIGTFESLREADKLEMERVAEEGS
ncbi:MAG: nucleotidyltransferase family protein [Thermoplasmata archaeon]